MHILLVEPEYYSRYPPLGLLKLASYYRQKGASVELVRGCTKRANRPDKIFVTSLFSWAWKPVWAVVKHYKRLFHTADLWLGGIYASLMPDHAKSSGADYVFEGVFKDAEEIMPAYDLVPEWDGSIITTSRGCNRRCPYCAVWQIEGEINSTKKTIKHLVHPEHTRIILWDNNILQSPNWRDVFEELIWFSQIKRMSIDFNQGLDARLITDEVAEKIAKMKTLCVRVSYDNKSVEKHVEEAISTISSYGIRGRRIGVYMLFNYEDAPDEFFNRVKNVLNWGAVAVPLRFQPLDTLKYNAYIGLNWNKERLEQFSRFRRVCGFGGVFPPYKWLVRRFNESFSFDEAFQLPERNDNLTARAHKDYFKSWRKIQDWRTVSKQFLAKKW
jgi:hypothetical protein